MMNFDISNNVKELLDDAIVTLVIIICAICGAISSQRKDAGKESDDQ